MANRVDTLEVGTLVVTSSASLPSGSIGNSQLSTDANKRIDSDKVAQQFPIEVYISNGSVVDGTYDFYLSRQAGTIKSISIRTEAAPSSTKTHDFVVKKAADAGSYTAITDSKQISSSTTAQTREAFTVNTSTYSQNDAFQVTITDGGSGTDATGVIVFMHVEETPS